MTRLEVPVCQNEKYTQANGYEPDDAQAFESSAIQERRGMDDRAIKVSRDGSGYPSRRSFGLMRGPSPTSHGLVFK